MLEYNTKQTLPLPAERNMERRQEQHELDIGPSPPKLSNGHQSLGPYQGGKIHHGIHLAMTF